MMHWKAKPKSQRLALAGMLLIFVLTAWGHAQQAQAQGLKKVGELTLTQGVVKVRHLAREKVYRQAGTKVDVFQGNVLQTGPDSRAQLILLGDENERVDIYPNSQMKVHAVSTESSRFGMNIGKALFGVFRTAARKRFQVDTPTATIGVKGTQFVVGSDGGNTFLLTTEGTVSMVNRAFPNIEVLVGQNNVSLAPANTPPTLPVAVTPDVSDNIVSEDGLNTFQQLDLPPPVTTGENAENEEEQTSEEEESSQEEEEESSEESSNEDDSGSGEGEDDSGSATDDGGADAQDVTDQLNDAQDVINDSVQQATILEGLRLKIIR